MAIDAICIHAEVANLPGGAETTSAVELSHGVRYFMFNIFNKNLGNRTTNTIRDSVAFDIGLAFLQCFKVLLVRTYRRIYLSFVAAAVPGANNRLLFHNIGPPGASTKTR